MTAALLLAALPLRAVPVQQRLAVLEFEVGKGLEVDRIFFSDAVREAVGARAPQLFVMTRESTEVLLQGSGKTAADCAGECEVETGRSLGADYVVSGRITRLGTRLVLSMRLHGTADGRLLKAATAMGKDVDALVDESKKAIDQLLSALPAGLAAAAPAPAAAPSTAAPEVHVEPKSGLPFVHVPGGTFRYGCEPQDEQCEAYEKPARSKSLRSFWLGRTPVTLGAYQRCFDAGACTEPATLEHCNWKTDRTDHPVNCVNAAQAEAFCAWAGGRLPTSQEWEYAAKGGESRIYPWGDAPPTGKLANYCDARCPEDWKDAAQDDGYAETSPVGAFPAGASRFGLLDMAGNVWQWTSTPYGSKKKKDAGKLDLRGGSWHHPAQHLRASYRHGVDAKSQVGWGFRCAQESPVTAR